MENQRKKGNRQEMMELDGHRKYFSIKGSWKLAIMSAVGIMAAVICLMTLLLSQMSASARRENESHLLEIARQVADNLDTKLEQNWKVLKSIDYEIKTLSGDDEDKLFQFVQQVAVEWGYDHIYLIDDSGYSVDENGQRSRLLPGNDAIELLRTRKSVSFLRQDDTRNSTVFFAMPVKKIRCGSLEISAVGLDYKLDDVLEALTIQAFDHQGICYVIDQDGSRLFNTASGRAQKNYNIFSYLEQPEVGGKESVEAIRSAIEGQYKGVTQYGKRGEEEYLGYVPVNRGKWMLLVSVSESILGKNMNKFSREVVIGCSGIVILLILLFTVLFWYINRKADRKRDEDVYNRERMLNLLTESSNEIYLMYNNTNSQLEYVSPNYERVAGWDYGAIRMIFEPDLTADEEELWRSEGNIPEIVLKIREEFLSWNKEHDFVGSMFQYQNKGGQLRWFRLEVYPAHLGEENVFIGILADVTRDREQREALEQALKAANSANAAKSRFLSNMSHDIRTPMNAILGMAAIADSHAEEPEYVRDCMTKLSYASKHLLGLINEVLDMSQIESGRMDVHSKPFSLAKMLEAVVTMIGIQAEEKQIAFTLEEREVCADMLMGDEAHLSRVLVNILSNAIKFTPSGGRIDFIVTQRKQCTPGTAAFRFQVSDTGMGMTQKFVETIFQPFTRADESIESGIQGTGLGMAIAGSLVELMGGTIQVDSEVGKGSTFTVDLELGLENHDESHAEGEKEGKSYDWSEKRFLIVEDSPVNAEILMELLHMEGAESERAENGREAVRCFEESEPGRYDAILMDVQMPVMNGYEAAKAIRSLSRKDAGEIPIIALTANAFAEDERMALKSGMNAHASKPVDMKQLETVLAKVCLRSWKQNFDKTR